MDRQELGRRAAFCAIIGLIALLAATLARGEGDANSVRIHVASYAEAKRLSADDQLGRYFDCLQFIPATVKLESCE
jgi:hypothetical protein